MFDLREKLSPFARYLVPALFYPFRQQPTNSQTFSQPPYIKIMSNSPKLNERKMLKVLNAWKRLAPGKKFGGKTLDEYDLQVGKSLTPRENLVALKNQELQEIATREDEDLVTLADIETIVAGVVADPTEGSNSALYEAMGYVRKSERKSGLTRKKKQPQD